MVLCTLVKGNGQLKNPYFEKESSLNAFCGMFELQKLQQIETEYFQGYSYSHFCIIIINFNNQKHNNYPRVHGLVLSTTWCFMFILQNRAGYRI